MQSEYFVNCRVDKPPLESLSRMSRKVHVRFLGDKGGAIRLRYPTKRHRHYYMKYFDIERHKAIEIRDKILRVPGNRLFFGKEREFVFSVPELNLWVGIRQDAKE